MQITLNTHNTYIMTVYAVVSLLHLLPSCHHGYLGPLSLSVLPVSSVMAASDLRSSPTPHRLDRLSLQSSFTTTCGQEPIP